MTMNCSFYLAIAFYFVDGIRLSKSIELNGNDIDVDDYNSVRDAIANDLIVFHNDISEIFIIANSTEGAPKAVNHWIFARNSK